MSFPPGTIGAMSASYLVLEPTDVSTIPNGALAIDSTNSDVLTVKNTGGGEQPIGEVSNINTKSMQNKSGVTIAIGRPVSKKPDGSIIDGDSDGSGTYTIIGVTLAAIAHLAEGMIQLIGTNVSGAITDLGFTPGQAVFLGENGGYIVDASLLTGDNDSIIRIGYADCAAGPASAIATDLILFAEVESIA